MSQRAWPAADLWMKQASGGLADLTPCPACGCPAATHFADRMALLCPPEGSDPVRLAEMVMRAPAVPRPSILDPANIKNSTPDEAARAVNAYRKRNAPAPTAPTTDEIKEAIARRPAPPWPTAEEIQEAIASYRKERTANRLEAAQRVAGTAGIGTPPPYYNTVARESKARSAPIRKPAPKRRFVLDEE